MGTEHIKTINEFMVEWKKEKGIEGMLNGDEKIQIIKEYGEYLYTVIPVKTE